MATAWHGDVVPPGYRLSASQAIELARVSPGAAPAIESTRGQLEVSAATYGERRWQVEFRLPAETRAEVHLDDRTGRVLESWTGDKAEWRGARGSKALHDEGDTGVLINSTWVWLGLSVLFLLPFIDPRRPFRSIHLDLLALLGLTVSHVFLDHGRLGWSILLAWPVLAALALRLAALLRSGDRESRGSLVPIVPRWALVAGLLALLALRAGANIADSIPADVAYAGVGGADRIEHGLDLYTAGGGHFDTYGPINYLMYVPFEQVFPLRGSGDADLWSAHAASIAFDLLTALAHFLIGTRLRRGSQGTLLGLALAYAWAAFPYSWYALSWNTNDSAVPMLLLLALLAISLPVLSAVLLGLATTTKFSPAIAGGVMLRYVRLRTGPAATAWFAVTAVLVTVGVVALYLPDGGLREFYDATVGFQFARETPFSPWGQLEWLDPLRVALKVLLGGLALASLLWRRPRDLVDVCAVIAALLVVLQLGLSYWTETYVVWFAPLALVAMTAGYSTARAR